jgi:hypothetical protein
MACLASCLGRVSARIGPHTVVATLLHDTCVTVVKNTEEVQYSGGSRGTRVERQHECTTVPHRVGSFPTRIEQENRHGGHGMIK